MGGGEEICPKFEQGGYFGYPSIFQQVLKKGSVPWYDTRSISFWVDF